MRIKNKLHFYLGISTFIISCISSTKTGWVTNDYGITISFFGLFYSLIVMICPNMESKYEIKELKNEK